MKQHRGGWKSESGSEVSTAVMISKGVLVVGNRSETVGK